MTVQTLTLLPFVLLLWVAAWHLRSATQRQALLLIASYLFYGSVGKVFLLVLVSSSLMNYFLGIALRQRPTAARLWAGVALNVLLLAFFKYLPPLAQAGAADSWLLDLSQRIIMPLGISFWTFQGLSYLFDVYREGELDPSLLEFCLYMAFWPTVLSGPVCRLPDMLPQFRETRGFNHDDLAIGTQRLIQGLIMKFALAEILASGLAPGEGITAGFDQMKGGWGAVDVWVLAVGFGLQLFFDFAGYSHIMIGMARLFGIRLQDNFDRPYLSATPSVFWTRWHMSLSFWIRDYVFLPLAALRRGRWWFYIVLISAMALFGLWHAAKATFIVWGIYHGVLLVIHRIGQQLKRHMSLSSSQIGGVLAWSATFSSVSLGWIFFRADDLDQALRMLGSLFSATAYGHLSLPSSLYFLVPSVLIGYFGYEAFVSSLVGWGEVYGTNRSPSKGGVLAVEGVQLLRERMWWWLAPMSLVTLTVAGIMIFEQSVAVTPFMYTLF
jgi:alginate O-acetyltransferase complex protein AlgI